MKKLSIVLLSVLLLIVFVGCDLSVETMGKMGNNLAGTDKKYVANIIKQTAPEAAEKKISAGATVEVIRVEGVKLIVREIVREKESKEAEEVNENV